MKILINVLYEFATLPLLHMRLVNHRFQNLIIKIVHSRLLLAASLKDRRLIFECYHPSAQYTEPYLFCDYLGTPGLSDNIAGVGSIYQAHTGDGLLRKLYSRLGQLEGNQTPRRHKHIQLARFPAVERVIWRRPDLRGRKRPTTS